MQIDALPYAGGKGKVRGKPRGKTERARVPKTKTRAKRRQEKRSQRRSNFKTKQTLETESPGIQICLILIVFLPFFLIVLGYFGGGRGFQGLRIQGLFFLKIWHDCGKTRKYDRDVKAGNAIGKGGGPASSAALVENEAPLQK
eukprot:4234317-Amphidinium_carterae.1